jgi:hypothetical protein
VETTTAKQPKREEEKMKTEKGVSNRRNQLRAMNQNTKNENEGVIKWLLDSTGFKHR